MTNYYFLASYLPELEIGHVPALNFEQLKELIKVNVSVDDQKVIRDFLRVIDFENFRAFWSQEPLDPRGNLTEKEIEQSLNDRAWPNDDAFPLFLLEYLDQYTDDAARLLHFPQLMSEFFQVQSSHENAFVAEYSTFQRELQLVLSGFRAKLIHRDIIQELQYEDSKDPIVAQLIAQKDAKQFEPPFEYRDLKPILEEWGHKPLELHKALYEYQFRQIIERWGGSLFSIERILNYMARLLLVERWLDLDMQKGLQIVDSVEGNIR